MKIMNLDTNEAIDVNTYGNDKSLIVPAILLYWGKSNLAIDREGLLIRGTSTNEQFLDSIDECFRMVIRPFLVGKTHRPFVANGKRVFAIADNRTVGKLEDSDMDYTIAAKRC